MSHSADANKMVSDTPRTDAALLYSICLDLQDENNALKDRINRLEAVVNDPEALWTNWLRGDVKLPAGIGDVRQYQERIQRLEEFARTIENDFDHDEDAHRYGTMCRVCDAAELLRETKAKEAKL